MNRKFKYKTLHILVLFILVNVSACKDVDSQPRIVTNNGNLTFQAARDKNITIRISGVSNFFINNVNALDVIKKRFALNKVVDERDISPVNVLSSQLESFKNALLPLLALATRLNRPQSRPAVRRNLGRIREVLNRIRRIENNLQVNECQGSDGTAVCKNGGICYDGYKDFYCECPDGWTGKTCADDVDECYLFAGTDLGCRNNADCINTIGSYSCFCRNGFYGTHCSSRTAKCENSKSTELCGHGLCVAANTEPGYTCLCDQGWTKDQVVHGAACVLDINECEGIGNSCHSECINTPGSFKCGPCPRGYSGDGIKCVDIDECQSNNGGCSLQPKVSCINTEGSYHCGNCPFGWQGDGHSCEPLQANGCASTNICHPLAHCDYVSDTTVCTCPSGMSGHGFGANGCTTEGSLDPCENHVCQNNGTCLVEGRGTRCVCASGFTGPTCSQGDACYSAPCLNGGTCVLLPNNNYRCVCSRGSTGRNCEIVRSVCGSVLRQTSGVLAYPQDGDTYGPSERCAWIIRTSPQMILNVTFNKFDVEDTPDCNKDWLQIHDGRSLAKQLIGRFCGSSKPGDGNILSSQHDLFFWFRSDNATNKGGFNISWHSVEPLCGEALNLVPNQHGIIRSPGYPGKTPAHRDCQWNFMAPFGQRLQLRFFEVNLGGDRNCTKDYIKIFDSDTLLRSVCETARIEPVHSSSNLVNLHYHTDAFGTDSSFQMHFEVVPAAPHCGGVFTEPQGLITGYMNAPVCLYLIKQPKGTKIKLSFYNFDLLHAMQILEIFDGNSDESPLLHEFSGQLTALDPILSSSNEVLLRYKYQLVGLNLPKTFEVKYERVCDETFSDPEGGILMTPNYPGPYLSHMTCTFRIVGPVNTIVHINFTDFSLSRNKIPDIRENIDQVLVNKSSNDLRDEYSDFLEIFISNKDKRRFYEGIPPMHLVSQNNIMPIVFRSAANEEKARGFKAEYYFEHVTCGGVLTEREGNFFHQEFSIDKPRFCIWVIEAPPGRHIQLDMNFAQTMTSKEEHGCSLLIYSNSSQNNDELLGSYCQFRTHINEPFHVNVLSIIVKMRYVPFLVTVSGNYKFISDDAECGGNFTRRNGVIKSPSWPGNYGPSMDCTWVITAPLGHKIELVVRNFSLETTSSMCSDDSLEIRNGHDASSPLIGKYCGTNIPTRIPSFGNILYLHFTSDDYISDAGFYLTWQQTETGCGGLLNSYKGSIHSPHNADVSAGIVFCDWQIVVAVGSTININVTKLGADVEFCKQSMLFVHDGPTISSPLLSFACDNKGDTWLLMTTSNNALIRYNQANAYDEGLQFFLDYETNCNVYLDGLSGVIESPNFPENYPPGMNCRWDIHGGRNNKFLLTFSHLALEVRDNMCDYDYVEVIDMLNDDQLSKKHLCTDPRDVVASEGNRLIIKFVSDYSEHANGFRAEFKRIGCGEHFTRAFGHFESPNAPYSVDMNCDWYIDAAPGKQIILDFHDLHIETTNADCSTDVLIVSEERNSTTPLLNNCQVEEHMVTVTSQTNRLYIRFVTSEVRARKYFKATFTVKDAVCGGTYRGSSGLIASPNYPRGFASNVECVWILNIEDSYGILLRFQEFNITDSNCTNAFLDIIKITDNKEYLLERACGDTKPMITLAHGNWLKVVFKAAGNYKGRFLFEYKKQCGGLMPNTIGYIKSHVNERCEWKFENPEGEHIFLDILHLECQCTSSNNCTNGLQLTNANDDSKMLQICRNPETHIEIPTNNLLIESSLVEFVGKYSAVQRTCGGTLTSLRGILTSPRFPNSYPANVECVWNIRAASGNYLEIIVDNLDISKSENCNEDYLEMREQNERGKLLGLFCSDNMLTNIFYAYEEIWIKFRSAECDDSCPSGFRLRWNYAHTNELNTTTGIIKSPPLISIRDDKPYNWRIIVPRGQYITLDVKEYNDGLNLYDGFDDLTLKVDIPHSPWQFVSSSHVLYLTSKNNELDKFIISWNATTEKAANSTGDNCHSVFTIANNTPYLNISSPGYPRGYNNNMDCEWLLKPTEPSEHVVFNLYEARLEDSPNCIQADYLRVLTSSNMVHWHEELIICTSKAKNMLPLHTVHGTPYIKLQFHSDFSSSGVGFTSLAMTTCGTNMTGPLGIITAENIKITRLIDNQCLWHIEVRPGKKIKLNFDYAPNEIDASQPCKQYAIVYDGTSDNAPILPPGHICNQNGRNVKTLEASSNRITVKYVLNSTFIGDQKHLWNLTYREFSECDDEIRLTHFASSVNISSPNYPNVPQPHTECDWIIIGPVGETLEAVFVDRFDMNMMYCTKEYVQFFDGATRLAPSLGKYCYRPKVIRSTNNIIRLHYLTDINEPRNGFRVNISIASCGGTFSNTAGDITSPGYPALGAYKKYSVCAYTIKVPQKWRIRLNVTDLHIPFDAKNLNSSDRIEVEDLSDNRAILAVWYGNVTTLPVLDIDSNMVTLRFYTFKGSNYRGFKLKYSRIYGICFRDINNEFGTINLNNISSESLYMTCRWKITVPKGQHVAIKFLNVRDQDIVNNTTGSRSIANSAQVSPAVSITFYNDENMLSRITNFSLANYNSSTIIRSTDNFMYVRIKSNRPLLRLSTLKAEYSSEGKSPCPPNIASTQSGAISNLDLPMNVNFFCQVEFSLDSNETLTFHITELTVLQKSSFSRPDAIRFGMIHLFLPYKALDTNITNTFVSLSQGGSLSILQSDVLKIQNFAATYRRHACGGDYDLDAYNFKLEYPLNLQEAYGPVECAWSLRAKVLGRNSYRLVGNVSFTDSCDQEYITLYAGKTPDSATIAKICRDSTTSLGNITIRKMYTTFIYHTDVFNAKSSYFSIQAEKSIVCGSKTRLTLAGRSSSLTINSETYKNNMECDWEFEAESGFHLKISFFNRFFIEDSTNCTKDHLEILRYDAGLWIPITRLCGREIPPTLIIPSERIQVVFRTNDVVTGDGFSFVVNPTCTYALNVTTEPQTINTPYLNVFQYNAIDCSYTFESNSTKAIIINIVERNSAFNIPRCDLVAYKKDENNNEVEAGRYCANSIISAHNYVNLKLGSTTGKTFQIVYQLNTCGGNITQPTVIHPLRKIGNNDEETYYEGSMNCVWHIVAPADHSILIRFKYFDMEHHAECDYDNVAIFTGSLPRKEKQVAKLCGHMDTAPTVMVDSNVAVVTAVSDNSLEFKGFQADVVFTRNCNERITLTDGNLPVTLMRNYTINASEEALCQFRVMPPAGHRVKVLLKSLELNVPPCQTDSCEKCNNLQVLDSANDRSKSVSIGKFCKNGQSTVQRLSSYRDLLMNLELINSGHFNFEIVLQIERSICGDIQELELKNEVRNIRFPVEGDQYPANAHCIWHIKSEHDYQLKLDYLKLQNVSLVTGKCIDYLSIADNIQQYFCGEYAGFTKYIYGHNTLEILFHSDDFYESKGFSITIQNYFSCNRTHSILSDSFQYSTENIIQSNNTGCLEEIRVPEGYFLNIHISVNADIFFPMHTNCSKRNLMVIDAKTNTTIFQRCRTYYVEKTLQTTTNWLRLQLLQFSKYTVFYFASLLEPGCGGQITTLEGYILSPVYHTNRNFSDCRWDLQVPVPNRIRLEFYDFDMGPSTNCELDYVNILDITNEQDKLIRHLCGNNMMESFIFGSSHIAIISKKSPNFDGMGWKLHFQMVTPDSTRIN